jgi:lipoprotein signal peptidase
MPGRALIERRPWLLASIASAVAFAWLQGGPLPGVQLLVLKAAPMLLLAAYALLRHRGNDTRILGLMIILEGIGAAFSDMFEDMASMVMALGFAFGIGLFVVHRRERPSASQKALAVALLLLTPVICQLVVHPGALAGWAPAGFGLVLGGMAASAWMSRFPRYRVGIGAVAIVIASILALYALRLVEGGSLAQGLAWPLLYVGNLLMATGITGELRARAG